VIDVPGSVERSLGLVETQRVALWNERDPLVLESGEQLDHVEVAYETYGELDARASNCVFVCHALTGDAHAAGHHGDPRRRGWWDNLIGPGKPLDTDRLFVVCANLLGGCQGTTGPGSPDPRTGKPYGLRFPLCTVRDLVTVHRRLLRHLGVERPLAAIGGSVGGMQVLQWSLDYPDELESGLVICASARLTAQNIAFSAVARAAIMEDENFHGGDYYEHGVRPDKGLSLARRIAHITYLSEESMRAKFGRRLQHDGAPLRGFGIDFAVESYLEYQGESFVNRFDANSYLYLTRVMDYFDPLGDVDRLRDSHTRFLVLSFDTDWRFPTAHSREIVRVLTAGHVPVTFREIESPHGHDSFLLPVPEYHRTVAAFVERTRQEVCA
jgi:homoserine O-acetyltransferase/O-succinyltransferase